MKKIIMGLCAALSLAACAGQVAAPAGEATLPTRAQAIHAAADTGASLADALHLAPPATLTQKVTIDDKAIRIAFRTWDTSLYVIDAFVATGVLVRNTPRALAVKRGVDTVTAGLVAASAAQRVGDAKSYGEALARAKAATAAIQTALKR